MPTWYRVILPNGAEPMPDKLKFLWTRARAASGGDPEFAAFLTLPPDNILYFSPIAVEFAIANYPKARPAAAPRRSDVQTCNSDMRSLDACFPA